MEQKVPLLQRTISYGELLGGLGLVLALGVLGAHFYRAGEYGLVAAGVGVLLFLCGRAAWKAYAVAFFLLFGVWEWAFSAYSLAQMRQGFGMPWARAALILLAVAGATALAAWYAWRRAERGAQALRNRQAARGQTAVQDESVVREGKTVREEEFAQDGKVVLGGGHPLLQGLVFIGVFLALYALRHTAPLNFLLLERYWPLWGSVQIFFAAWYGAVVAGLLLDPAKSRQARRTVWLIFALVFFLQFALGYLGIERMLLTGKLHVPVPAFILFAPIFRESFSMMPIIVLLAVLLTGSAWCSLLCYFGPFDSLAASSAPARPLPSWMAPALRYGRAAVLVLGCLAALILRLSGVSTSTAIGLSAAFALLSLILMALFSRRYRRMIHCTTFCPMGLVVNCLGRVSPWRIRVDSQRCDNCGACERACRYSAITPEDRAKGGTGLRCTLCRDCLSVCRKKALHLHCPGLSPARALLVFVGLAAGLHALFLSLAMV